MAPREDTMTYSEWIGQAKRVIRQYDEGAIFDYEAFYRLMASAMEVEDIKADALSESVTQFEPSTEDIP